MKKINLIPFLILFGLVLLGSLYFFFVYNKTEEPSSSPTKPKLSSLTVWVNEKESSVFESAIEEFEGTYGVKVNLVEKSEDHVKAIHHLNKNEKKPDIFLLSQKDIGVSASEKLIEPVSLSKEVKQSFYPSTLQAFSYNGLLYSVPKHVNTPVLVTNKKLMEQAPKQLSDLLTKKHEKPGFAFNLNDIMLLSSINHTFGGFYFETETKEKQDFLTYHVEKSDLLSPGLEQSFQFIKEMKKHIPFELTQSQLVDSFTKQDVASILISSQDISDIADTSFEKDIMPMPGLKPDQPSHMVVDGDGFAISSSSKQKELALHFLEIIMSKENVLFRLETKQEIPPLQTITKEDIENVKFENDTFKKILVASQTILKTSDPYPTVAPMKDYNSKLQAALTNTLEQNVEPKKSLQFANEEFNWLLRSNY